MKQLLPIFKTFLKDYCGLFINQFEFLLAREITAARTDERVKKLKSGLEPYMIVETMLIAE